MQTVYSQVAPGRAASRGQNLSGILSPGQGISPFQRKGWFDSFTYPQLGFNVKGGQISRAKIGNVKVKLHRPLAGEVKTLTLKNEGGKWYACFSCMVDAEPLPVHDSVLGIDVGLESFAVTSDGEITRQPTLLSEGTKAIAPKATSCVSLYQTYFGLAQGR